MADSVNKVIVLGNVGRDPEIRQTKDGGKIATLSIATSDKWKDKVTGEWKERTEWHRVVVMNDRLCDVVDRYVVKGARLYIEGKLQTRKWTDSSGQEKYTTEILIDRFKGEISVLDKPEREDEAFHPVPKTQVTFTKNSSKSPFDDDEIPF